MRFLNLNVHQDRSLVQDTFTNHAMKPQPLDLCNFFVFVNNMRILEWKVVTVSQLLLLINQFTPWTFNTKTQRPVELSLALTLSCSEFSTLLFIARKRATGSVAKKVFSFSTNI